MDCLFCAIVAGDIPARRIYEDEVAIAFLDIHPWQEGHTLVVPRRHSVDALADDEALAEIAPAVARVGRLLKERLGAQACNILSNAGPVSGQEVLHTHVHVLPRYADNPGITGMRGPVDSDLDAVEERLRRAP
ncbi:HIT family protein [Tessaracoccus lapidicaptus]|uniref:HIT family protein n=1 Tax=Tessaracoccus lapidicaptus TaxID=1427523 RepID=A0A1C0AR44_9ACTN|nr:MULTISPECIES: HIT domain-containing protein [Tessaracoccus]AQX14898.1 HIT family protein [Tessaracoccus sp. T2.5-30]OCL36742.1 HIT family protein [Tessaracoccus lapidicaptus]VEP39041.1 putative HIT-like protein [Tessaracoccus lapidicaptus]